MSQLEKQNSTKNLKGKRPSKMMVGIGVATMLVVGGGIGTGLYLSSDTNTPESKSESKIKQASKEKNPLAKTKEKDSSSDKEKQQEDDVLGIVLGKQETENSQVAAILDGPAQTSKEKTMQARTVALAAMAHLPSDVSATVLDTPHNVLPGNTDLKVNEDPLEPTFPEVVPAKPVVPEEVVPSPDPGETEPDPTPVQNVAPQLMTDNQIIHIGKNFNPYNFATASDVEDGDLTSSIQVVSNNVNLDKEGTYSVTYRVSDSAGETVENSISIEVVNDAPVVHVDDSSLSVGDIFNPMEGVSAYDTEDGDVTSHIDVFSNNVDTQTPGTYSVSYKVTDAFGKSTTKTVQVTVVNDPPIIAANDREILVGEDFQPLEGVSASDKQDGDLTSSIQVSSNDVDTTKAGTYHVTYVIEDYVGAKAEKTVTITVKEKNAAPEIWMDTNTIQLHVGDQPDWMVGVTANDKEDGNLTEAIKIDVSNVDLSQPGNYQVSYQVTDSDGLTTTKVVNVTVE
ncbi:DUF5011 domain-containing protein [Listeria monocytogenes]|nr:DUF5011 domain-containing protein [Listeria monocytogenes]